ncbi:MAG: sulfurtransferase, partial [Desulfamplus sp.]|nr:sulfurtransferase [Desulfamplus sp.]
MRKSVVIALGVFFVVLNLVSVAIGDTSPPADAKKHTEAGKYATSLEAYEMWKANPDKIKIIDCRTQEEYAFVGHAPMAYNIPSRFWTGKWN